MIISPAVRGEVLAKAERIASIENEVREPSARAWHRSTPTSARGKF
jgi:hypothetical protein